MPVPTIFGLVLSGGTEMPGDETRILDAYNLLLPHCEQVYVSARADQAHRPIFRSLPMVLDEYHDMGPMAGLLAALVTHPGHAWLVLSCIKEGITEDHLGQLVANRQPNKMAVAYWSDKVQGPDSMCALYEPAIFPFIEQARRQSRYSLRGVLQNLSIHLLKPEESLA